MHVAHRVSKTKTMNKPNGQKCTTLIHSAFAAIHWMTKLRTRSKEILAVSLWNLELCGNIRQSTSCCVSSFEVTVIGFVVRLDPSPHVCLRDTVFFFTKNTAYERVCVLLLSAV